jgi:hypothetical protein
MHTLKFFLTGTVILNFKANLTINIQLPVNAIDLNYFNI